MPHPTDPALYREKAANLKAEAEKCEPSYDGLQEEFVVQAYTSNLFGNYIFDCNVMVTLIEMAQSFSDSMNEDYFRLVQEANEKIDLEKYPTAYVMHEAYYGFYKKPSTAVWVVVKSFLDVLHHGEEGIDFHQFSTACGEGATRPCLEATYPEQLDELQAQIMEATSQVNTILCLANSKASACDNAAKSMGVSAQQL